MLAFAPMAVHANLPGAVGKTSLTTAILPEVASHPKGLAAWLKAQAAATQGHQSVVRWVQPPRLVHGLSSVGAPM
jgi:hypothetical protein